MDGTKIIFLVVISLSCRTNAEFNVDFSNGFRPVLRRTSRNTNLPETNFLFDKFASANGINRTQFQFLMKDLGLESGGKDLGKQSNKCMTADDVFSNNGFSNTQYLNVSSFQVVCPTLLEQIRTKSCAKKIVASKDINNYGKVKSAKAWGYGILSVTIISLASMLGAFVVPFMNTAVYKQVLLFMVSLAVGVLGGSGLLHLTPHAFGFGKDGSIAYLWKCSVIVVGVYFFFITENLMKIYIRFAEWKKTRRSKAKSNLFDVSATDSPDMPLSAIGDVDCMHDAHALDSVHVSDKNCQHEHGVDSLNIAGDHGVDRKNAKEYFDDNSSSNRVKIFEKVAPVAWMIILGDGLHNFIDGLAIGVSYTSNTVEGISTSLAIFCEELPHELGDFAILLNSGLTYKQAIVANFLSACTCYIGMVIGTVLGSTTHIVQWIYAMAAGMFLYISLVDMLPEATGMQVTLSGSSRRATIKNFLLVNFAIVLGYSLMLLLAIYSGYMKYHAGCVFFHESVAMEEVLAADGNVILETRKEVWFSINSKHVVNCTVKQSPRSKTLAIYWTRDGSRIQGDSGLEEVRINNQTHQLVFRNASIDESTAYTCHARVNHSFENSSTIYVHIGAKPAIPSFSCLYVAESNIVWYFPQLNSQNKVNKFKFRICRSSFSNDWCGSVNTVWTNVQCEAFNITTDGCVQRQVVGDATYVMKLEAANKYGKTETRTIMRNVIQKCISDHRPTLKVQLLDVNGRGSFYISWHLPSGDSLSSSKVTMARTKNVNKVIDHATYHKRCDGKQNQCTRDIIDKPLLPCTNYTICVENVLFSSTNSPTISCIIKATKNNYIPRLEDVQLKAHKRIRSIEFTWKDPSRHEKGAFFFKYTIEFKGSWSKREEGIVSGKESNVVIQNANGSRSGVFVVSKCTICGCGDKTVKSFELAYVPAANVAEKSTGKRKNPILTTVVALVGGGLGFIILVAILLFIKKRMQKKSRGEMEDESDNHQELDSIAAPIEHYYAEVAEIAHYTTFRPHGDGNPAESENFAAIAIYLPPLLVHNSRAKTPCLNILELDAEEQRRRS
eukprot:gene16746-18440_t